MLFLTGVFYFATRLDNLFVRCILYIRKGYKMRTQKMTIEVGTALNVLLKELGIDYATLDQETITNLTTAISNDTEVTNTALLYLTCDSERAGIVRERLVNAVLDLYERNN